MNKYKSLLCFVLVFCSACSTIDNKPSNNDLVIVDKVSKDEPLKDQNLNDESNHKTDIIMNEVNKEEQENDIAKPNEQIKEEHKNEEKPNKPSSSIGKDDSSSNKNDSKNESSSKNEIIENVEEQIEESLKEETKEEVKEDIIQQPEIEQETKSFCENHKWDDSFGNSPQFSELIFDNWQECDSVMNDIYNNFISEENPDYGKYYKNSKGQWISSISAFDVWCECGAHVYAIFITYE